MAGELKRNQRKFYFREVGAERAYSGSNILKSHLNQPSLLNYVYKKNDNMYLVVQMRFHCDNPHVTGEHVLQTRVCLYVCVVTKITKVCDDKLIDIDIFVNCNWVNTRWQWYSTHN